MSKNQTSAICEKCGLPVPLDWRDGKTLGERLQLLRLRSRLGLREAARGIGMSPTTLGNIENKDQDPKMKTFVKLRDFYNVTGDELLFELEY